MPDKHPPPWKLVNLCNRLSEQRPDIVDANGEKVDIGKHLSLFVAAVNAMEELCESFHCGDDGDVFASSVTDIVEKYEKTVENA